MSTSFFRLASSGIQEVCAAPHKGGSWLDATLRVQYYNHWNGQCAYCSTPLALRGCSFDHVIDGPHAGGCHHSTCNLSWNVVPVCGNCNVAKGQLPGNWYMFLDHVAVMMRHAGDPRDISEIAASIKIRFITTLYTPVAGYEKQFKSFIGPEALRGAYVLAQVGPNPKAPIFKVLA